MAGDRRDLIVVGQRVALGPMRRDLAETYARWVNDLEVRHGLQFAGVVTPQTEETFLDEAMKAMAERQPTAVHFTIYDREDGEPVGTASLMDVNHFLGRARFGILLGERRGQGLGAETTRLVLGVHRARPAQRAARGDALERARDPRLRARGLPPRGHAPRRAGVDGRALRRAADGRDRAGVRRIAPAPARAVGRAAYPELSSTARRSGAP
jgi:GNAT acetyltransferase-like protein